MTTTGLQFPSIDSFIAKLEGFGTPNAITINNANNPGALIPGTIATANGATGSTTTAGGQPIAVFPTLQAGVSAEDQLVAQQAANDASIQDLINIWAPATAPGNTTQSNTNYAASLASFLGVNTSTPIRTAEQNFDTANNVSGATFTTPGSGTKTTIPAATTSTASTDGSGLLGTLGSTVGSLLGIGTSTSNAPATFSWARVGAFVLGLILIAGGLYLFKPVQSFVKSTVRTGRRVAEIGATA